MKKYTTTLFAMMLTALIAAQTTSAISDKPTIEVNGYAELDVVPDEIYISITLKEYMDGREKVTIAQQEERMMTKLKEADASMSNLSVSNANGDFVRVRWNKKDVLTSKEFELKVGTAEEAGKVFQAMEDVEYIYLHIQRVWHSKMEELKTQVHKQAMRNAKEKATYLLAELGKSCGGPLRISENTTSAIYKSAAGIQVGKYSEYDSLYQSYDKVGGGSTGIQFQKIKLIYELSSSFEIV